MDILHEWELERYGKLDVQIRNSWSNLQDEGLSLKILASRKLVISSQTAILESFSLFNSMMWLECFQKGESLLVLHKLKGFTRKFRLKFMARNGKSSLDICNDVVRVLRQYITVTNVSCQGVSLESQPMEQDPPMEYLTGDVSQQQITKAVLGVDKFRLPVAYSSCNYPTDELETLLRLCISDPNFPAFVAEVEKVLKTVTSDK